MQAVVRSPLHLEAPITQALLFESKGTHQMLKATIAYSSGVCHRMLSMRGGCSGSASGGHGALVLQWSCQVSSCAIVILCEPRTMTSAQVLQPRPQGSEGKMPLSRT